MNKSSALCPKRKILYRFTCFVAQGDLSEDIAPEDMECTSDHLSNGHCNGAREKPEVFEEDKNNNHSVYKEEEVKEEYAPRKKEIDPEVIKKQEEDMIIAEQKTKEEEERRLILEGYKSKDGQDPFIYSSTVGISPKSFITFDYAYKAKCPPPTYLSEKEIYEGTKIKKHEFLEGFEIPPEGGLLCTDKEVIKRQSGVIGSMIKQLITTMCISRVSLPVRIFEAKSTLERIADLWRFAPIYLHNAAKAKDKLDRFKQTIAFGIAGMYCSMQQLKPFNPIIGETLEATLEDGTKVYAEHTSHHPAISHFYLEGPNSLYKMYGHYEYKVHVSPNTLEGLQDGPNIIEFGNGHKITFYYPKFKIHGLIMGDRMVYPSGTMVFEDPANRLKAVVVFNYGKKRGFFSSRKKGTKIDDLEGIIYYVRKGAKQDKMVAEIKDLKDVERPVGQITGSWLKFLKIAGTTYWDIEKVEPKPLKFEKDPLPSDWRFREDLIWLRRRNMEIAQEWKLRLEAEQRRDRVTREKFGKKS